MQPTHIITVPMPPRPSSSPETQPWETAPVLVPARGQARSGRRVPRQDSGRCVSDPAEHNLSHFRETQQSFGLSSLRPKACSRIKEESNLTPYNRSSPYPKPSPSASTGVAEGGRVFPFHRRHDMAYGDDDIMPVQIRRGGMAPRPSERCASAWARSLPIRPGLLLDFFFLFTITVSLYGKCPHMIAPVPVFQ